MKQKIMRTQEGGIMDGVTAPVAESLPPEHGAEYFIIQICWPDDPAWIHVYRIYSETDRDAYETIIVWHSIAMRNATKYTGLIGPLYSVHLLCPMTEPMLLDRGNGDEMVDLATSPCREDGWLGIRPCPKPDDSA